MIETTGNSRGLKKSLNVTGAPLKGGGLARKKATVQNFRLAKGTREGRIHFLKKKKKNSVL